VVGDAVHYLWGRRLAGARWVLMHSSAPTSDPTSVEHDPRNPVLTPSRQGFDDQAVEYPFPFKNRADGKFYVYYRGKGRSSPEQTGLLVSDGDFGKWTRVRTKDFRSFEANPHNPVFTPSEDKGAWDSDGVLTPNVIEIGGTYYMVYAGKKGREWQTGLAVARK